MRGRIRPPPRTGALSPPPSGRRADLPEQAGHVDQLPLLLDAAVAAAAEGDAAHLDVVARTAPRRSNAASSGRASASAASGAADASASRARCFQGKVERREALQGDLQARGRPLGAASGQHVALDEGRVRVDSVVARGLVQLGERGGGPLRRGRSSQAPGLATRVAQGVFAAKAPG